MARHLCRGCGAALSGGMTHCEECADDEDIPEVSRRAKRQSLNRFARMEARLDDEELRQVERYGRVLDGPDRF